MLRALQPKAHLTTPVIRINLAIVAGFALTALGLLTRTYTETRAAQAGIEHTLNPSMLGARRDTEAIPVLNTTADLTSRMVATAESMGKAMSHSRETTTDAVGTTPEVRNGAHSIAESISSTGDSVASITNSLQTLEPVLSKMFAETGDIRSDLGAARVISDRTTVELGRTFAAMKDFLGHSEGIATNLSEARRDLHVIAGQAENIEGAELLRLTELRNAPLPAGPGGAGR